MLPANTPTFDEETRVLTLPSVEGVQWEVNGHPVQPGTMQPLEEGEIVEVEAKLADGFFTKSETEWMFG